MPTEAQKKAGNYAKKHVFRHGFRISVENRKGSIRRGKDENGQPWEVKLAHDYGYIRGTLGRDGDKVDCFLGPDHTSELVFVVNQVREDTRVFDEHKVMLGFRTLKEARAAYLANYSPGWKGLGSIIPTTIQRFKTWLREKRTYAPFMLNAKFDTRLLKVKRPIYFNRDEGLKKEVREKGYLGTAAAAAGLGATGYGVYRTHKLVKKGTETLTHGQNTLEAIRRAADSVASNAGSTMRSVSGAADEVRGAIAGARATAKTAAKPFRKIRLLPKLISRALRRFESQQRAIELAEKKPLTREQRRKRRENRIRNTLIGALAGANAGGVLAETGFKGARYGLGIGAVAGLLHPSRTKAELTARNDRTIAFATRNGPHGQYKVDRKGRFLVGTNPRTGTYEDRRSFVQKHGAKIAGTAAAAAGALAFLNKFGRARVNYSPGTNWRTGWAETAGERAARDAGDAALRETRKTATKQAAKATRQQRPMSMQPNLASSPAAPATRPPPNPKAVAALSPKIKAAAMTPEEVQRALRAGGPQVPAAPPAAAVRTGSKKPKKSPGRQTRMSAKVEAILFNIRSADYDWQYAPSLSPGAAYRKGRRMVPQVRRAGEVVQDISDIAGGVPKDPKKKRFYEKSWFSNAVAGAALGTPFLVSRHRARVFKNSGQDILAKIPVLKKLPMPAVPLAARLPRAVQFDSPVGWPKGTDMWAKRRGGNRNLKIAGGVAGAAGVLAVIQAMRMNKLRPSEAARLASLQPAIELNYNDAAGWDVRDARGNSARVFTPGARRRHRREKQWHEKTSTLRTAAVAGILGTVGLSGMHVGRAILARRAAFVPAITPKSADEIAGKVFGGKAKVPNMKPGRRKTIKLPGRKTTGGTITAFPRVG